jgi:hypothetical protein
MRVEPYPISGSGTVEVDAGSVRISGDRGIPWRVEVGGVLGLILGVVVSPWQRSLPVISGERSLSLRDDGSNERRSMARRLLGTAP